MSFWVRIRLSAAKDRGWVDKANRTRIAAAIDRLTDRPYAGNALKGDLRGLRRIRVGNYRVVYEVQDQVLVVLVVRVSHRRDAYSH